MKVATSPATTPKHHRVPQQPVQPAPRRGSTTGYNNPNKFLMLLQERRHRRSNIMTAVGWAIFLVLMMWLDRNANNVTTISDRYLLGLVVGQQQPDEAAALPRLRLRNGMAMPEEASTTSEESMDVIETDTMMTASDEAATSSRETDQHLETADAEEPSGEGSSVGESAAQQQSEASSVGVSSEEASQQQLETESEPSGEAGEDTAAGEPEQRELETGSEEPSEKADDFSTTGETERAKTGSEQPDQEMIYNGEGSEKPSAGETEELETGSEEPTNEETTHNMESGSEEPGSGLDEQANSNSDADGLETDPTKEETLGEGTGEVVETGNLETNEGNELAQPQQSEAEEETINIDEQAETEAPPSVETNGQEVGEASTGTEGTNNNNLEVSGSPQPGTNKETDTIESALSCDIPTLHLGYDQAGVSVDMPVLGAGLQSYNDEEAYTSLCHSFEAGYPMVDIGYGAASAGVARAMNECWKKERNDLFLVATIRGGLSYQETWDAHQRNLDALGVTHVDVLLLGSTVGPGRREQQWEAMEELYRQGKARSLGLSGYCDHYIEGILDIATVRPVLNRVDPPIGFDVMQKCQEEDILILPAATRLRPRHDEWLTRIGEQHNHKLASQVSLRYAIQQGQDDPKIAGVVFPQSTNLEEVRINRDVFDFTLTKEEMQQLNAGMQEASSGIQYHCAIHVPPTIE